MTTETVSEVKEFEVRMAREAVADAKKTLVYVGGLDEQVTAETLQEAFITFGEIAQLTIPRDAVSGKHRGFAFIEFDETDDATAAMVCAFLINYSTCVGNLRFFLSFSGKHEQRGTIRPRSKSKYGSS